MRDLIGRTLGHYRIVEKIGEGGMGVVYRAHDERLDRVVAVKVLPEEVAKNPDRLARFEREARAVAKLNHPNILAIHDFGDEDGIAFAVMELLDGESLREALLKAAGPLPWRRVQEIGVAVAAGLGAAHHRGIVHRDIKPENIFLIDDGHIKILDFGLAQIEEPVDADADTATLTPAGTVPGTVMGTVGYMSPEQVRGEPADARSDIFALGCVLYEMIAGRHAFKRETTAEIMTAILREEPRSLVESGVDIAPEVEKTVERCLHKNPERRFQSARDLAFAMESLTGSSAPLVLPAEQTSASKRKWPVITAATAGLAIFLAALLWQKPTGVDLSEYRFSPVATEAEIEFMAAWSPDGRSLAYTKTVNGRPQIFIRDLDSDAPIQITRHPDGADSPFWSPDGTRVWFQSIDDLWSAGRAGGEPEAKHLGGYIIGADLSPDGQTLATWSVTGENPEVGSVWIASPPEAELREYEPAPFRVEGAFEPDYIRFSPDGTQLLVSIQGDEGVEVWLLPYPDGGAARDRPKRVFADVRWTNLPQITWMPDGRRVVMAFAPTKRTGRQLWMADLRTESLTPLTAGVTEKIQPDVSPDGSTIVFSTSERDYNVVDVPLDGSSVRTLLATGQNEYSPAWIPGQDRFLYVTDRSGHDEIRLRSKTDGWDRAVVTQDDFPGDETRLLTAPVASPNGERVAYWRWPGEGRSSIWLSPIGGGTPVKLVESEGGQSAPDWSPDGEWVSFIWNNGGTYTIAKSRVGASDPPQPLTDRCVFAAVVPVWSPTGEWIAYYCYDEPDEGVRLVSYDGRRNRRLARVGRPNGFVWSPDGTTLFALRYSPGDPSLLAIDFATGDVTVVAEYTSGFTFASTWSPSVRYALAADGQSFSASIRRLQMDLWLLEGFDSQRSWRDWLR